MEICAAACSWKNTKNENIYRNKKRNTEDRNYESFECHI